MDAAARAGSNQCSTTRRSRFLVNEDTEDLVECSGKSCQSCSATLVADCVALCCCPCAVANLLVLAFLKVPWVVGRRCLRLAKKKMMMKKMKKKVHLLGMKGGEEKELEVGVGESDLFREWQGECGVLGTHGSENYCARFEAEKVWLELYQVGFGRVSFSGVPGKDF